MVASKTRYGALQVCKCDGKRAICCAAGTDRSGLSFPVILQGQGSDFQNRESFETPYGPEKLTLASYLHMHTM